MAETPQLLTLSGLLTRIGINNWDRALWFKGADLKGDVLVVQDAVSARFIRSCWLAQMQEHVKALQIMVKDGPDRTSQTVERRSAWKAGKAPQSQRLGGLD